MKRIMLLALFLLAWRSAAQAALATDCTLYASATGRDTNSGTTPTTPTTLTAASEATVPGSVVCLLGGTYNLSETFYPYHDGTASAWIVYKNYGDSEVRLLWTADATAADFNMIHFYSASFSTARKYIEIRGLTLDGQNAASVGLKCQYSHHLRFVGNTIKNLGASGIATKFCDYLSAEGNKIFHTGYRQGWSSGISYNSHQWLDTAPGFHSVVVNNIVTGSYDASANHTDGNGISIDLSNDSEDFSTANTPPVLIANNVVHANGGRCINTYVVSNIWTVNNTCYKNTLDLSQSGIGEVVANDVKNSYFINNLVYAWNGHGTYQQWGTVQNIKYYKNLSYNGPDNFTYSDSGLFLTFYPLLVNPLVLDPTKDGQYATALSPEQLGNRLMPQATSAVIDKGIDPTTLSGLAPELVAGLRQYVFKDIRGTARPQGSGFDLGAYEYTPLAAPTQLTVMFP